MTYKRRISGLDWLKRAPSDAPEPPEDQIEDEDEEKAEETEPEN